MNILNLWEISQKDFFLKKDQFKKRICRKNLVDFNKDVLLCKYKISLWLFLPKWISELILF